MLLPISFSKISIDLASTELHLSRILPGYLQNITPDGNVETRFQPLLQPQPPSQVKGKGQVSLGGKKEVLRGESSAQKGKERASQGSVPCRGGPGLTEGEGRMAHLLMPSHFKTARPEPQGLGGMSLPSATFMAKS